MSKQLLSVNFDELKFNLYDILALNHDATDNIIKKNFKKLVLELHPDKNKDSNDDIYNHVILANQVLTNKILRSDYDNFLNNKKIDHTELKNNFNSTNKDIDKFFPVKDDATKSFSSNIDILNKKHGFDNNLNNKNIMTQYEQFKKNRNTQVTIQQEKIINTVDFNNKFETRKEDGYNNLMTTNNNLNAYQSNDMLTSINDYSKLYSEDSVSTGVYTSLDMAFKLQKININEENINLKDKISDYKNQTLLFNNRKPNDFSNTKFHEWSN